MANDVGKSLQGCGVGMMGCSCLIMLLLIVVLLVLFVLAAIASLT